jgi:hypothetical protein
MLRSLTNSFYLDPVSGFLFLTIRNEGLCINKLEGAKEVFSRPSNGLWTQRQSLNQGCSYSLKWTIVYVCMFKPRCWVSSAMPIRPLVIVPISVSGWKDTLGSRSYSNFLCSGLRGFTIPLHNQSISLAGLFGWFYTYLWLNFYRVFLSMYVTIKGGIHMRLISNKTNCLNQA